MKQVLEILCGLPASGKSFYAKEKCLNNKNYIRVNRDSIRLMLQENYQFGNYKFEDVVTDACEATVKSALLKGLNIIIDDTNLNPKVINNWTRIVEEINLNNKNKISLEINNKFLEVSVEECIKRDYERGIQGKPSVGEQVILQMALRYNLINIDKCIFLDVDGTAIDCSERRQKSLMDNGKINFNRFHDFDLLETDKPRYDIIKEVNYFAKENNCKIIVVSGRSSAKNNSKDKEDIYRWTKNKLKEYGVNFDFILMRKMNDSRSDVLVKQDFLNLIGKEKILKCWDDRRCIVEFFRNNGLEVRVCDLSDPVNGGDF